MAMEKKREGSIITVTNDETGGVQMFHVASVGTLVLYHRPEGDIKGLSDAVKFHAAYHGMEQRIRDAGALGYSEELKRYATPQEKHAAMRELVDYYNSGATEWSVRGGISEGSLLFRALMRRWAEDHKDATEQDRSVRASKTIDWMKVQDEAAKKGGEKAPPKNWRAKLLDSDELIDFVRAIRKEDGKSLDADAMLDTLDGLDE